MPRLSTAQHDATTIDRAARCHDYRPRSRCHDYRQRTRSSVQFGEHAQPQPDISVIRPRRDGYRQRLPGPADILLLVELADSALSRDRRDKVPLYASHGIPEFWLINVAERNAEVFRNPADGQFRTAGKVGLDGFLTLLVKPDLHIPLKPLLMSDDQP